MRYLYNSQEIQKSLSGLFSKAGNKWAIVAFVGYNALEYIPTGVSDLSVVCWPKAGGTNPDGVRRLIDHGINVYFCERLHQKIYWTQGVGLIVGSANLSKNALGDTGLHEFGVYCEDKEFDVNQVLQELIFVQATSGVLAKLDVEHTAYARQNGVSVDDCARETPSFLESTNVAHPKMWKLLTWSHYRDSNECIQEEVKDKFGCINWVNDNDIDEKKFQIGDFVLQIKVNDDGVIERANARWLLVDHIVWKSGVRAVVQVKKIDERTPPPFLIDSKFKKCFKEAFNSVNNLCEVCDSEYFVKASFIRAICEKYASEKSGALL